MNTGNAGSHAVEDERGRPVTTPAEGRWENEGGAGRNAAPGSTRPAPVGVTAPHAQENTVTESNALDARQEELMAGASSDGRPPTRRRRMVEWRWLGASAIAVAAGITLWISLRGVSLNAIGAGLALGVLLLVGTIPVLAAGLLRGGEERAARRAAEQERPDRARTVGTNP